MAKKSARPPARKKSRARPRSRVVKPTGAATKILAVAAQGVSCAEVKIWVLAQLSDIEGRKVQPTETLKDLHNVADNDLIDFAIAFEGKFGSKVSETKLKQCSGDTIGELCDNYLCKLAQRKSAQPVPA